MHELSIFIYIFFYLSLNVDMAYYGGYMFMMVPAKTASKHECVLTLHSHENWGAQDFEMYFKVLNK